MLVSWKGVRVLPGQGVFVCVDLERIPELLVLSAK